MAHLQGEETHDNFFDIFLFETFSDALECKDFKAGIHRQKSTVHTI